MDIYLHYFKKPVKNSNVGANSGISIGTHIESHIRFFSMACGKLTHTQCDLKIAKLFSYKIKKALYYVSKLIFIQNRIHLTQYNVWNDQPIYP